MIKALELIAYGMAMASIYMVFRGVFLSIRADARGVLYNEIPKPFVFVGNTILPILSLTVFVGSLCALYSGRTTLFVVLFCVGVLVAIFAQFLAWDMKQFINNPGHRKFDD